ncbi:MAG: hypothetical protein QM597_07745 [Aeromicrobium sp.]|uniref:hypothetical protein n=1 Tax=Aeromicrobium sp. TaxID=1871063 RepID=UPI0039E279AD
MLLIAADILSPAQTTEMTPCRASLNPAQIGRDIAELQTILTRPAADKTEQIYLASIPTLLPDIRKGIRVKAAG